MAGTPLNVELWGIPYSTCTQRILCTLHELNAPYKLNEVDLRNMGNKQPAYLQQHQPYGQVPAAIIDGQSFFESRAIARIIAEFAPGSTLIPRDLKQKAIFEQFASLEYGTFNKPMEGIVAERVFKPGFYSQPADEENVKKLHTESQGKWKVLDQQLAGQQFITGPNFSLVDIFMAPYFQHFSTLPEGKEILSQHANIKAWWERVSSRESWKKCVKDGQASMSSKPS